MKSKAASAFALALLITARSGVCAPSGTSLPAEHVTRIQSATCGYVDGVWQPGEIRRDLFLTLQSRIKSFRADAKSKKGRSRTQLLQKAAKLARKLRADSPLCLSLPAPSAPGTSQLRFNIRNAVALSLGGSGALKSLSSSDLYRVTETGSVEPAVVSGSAAISRFLIAPNQKLYVVFSQKVDLATSKAVPHGGEGCLLAEISIDTGLPTCIEEEAEMINWSSTRKAIQFDSFGGIYYLATDFVTSPGTVTTRTLLRKHLNGVTVSLINDNITIPDFVVLPDGNVLLTGHTTSTSARWIRRISDSGAVSNVATSTLATFLELFPDGNVYYGMAESSGLGVKRFFTDSFTLDPKMWIGGFSVGDAPHHSVADICAVRAQQELDGFCNYSGVYVRSLHTTSTGKAFVLAGIDGNRSFMQYFPTLARPVTVIQQASVALSVLDSIVLAGLDASSRNRLTLVDTTAGTERDLLPGEDIEVYHIGYSTSGNRVLFDGLRFTDNTYVIGQVDMATGQVLITPTGDTRMVDLQTF